METKELEPSDAFVSLSADYLELYRDYAKSEIKEGKEDFLVFSDWKEENKEVLL